VTVNFWALNSLLDPALIEDTHVLQDFVPGWMDHSLHSCVLVFTLAELLLSYRPYPRWATLGRLRSTVVVLAYASWWVCALRWPQFEGRSGTSSPQPSMFYFLQVYFGTLVSRDSSVGIATGYGLDGPVG
jgi:hypothetical protein